LPTQKIVLKEILGFYKVGVKGVKWKRGYAYILSGRRDRICVENTTGAFFFCARRRWTAIGMGAFRARPAIDPLAPAKDQIY
jgi:hypothetical protein